MKLISLFSTMLVLLACATAGGKPGGKPDNGEPPAANPFELTGAELELATELAESYLDREGLRTEGPLYLVAAEIVRNKEAELEGGSDRYALLTHYRYDGDLSVLTHMNLSRREITEVETIENYPAPLSEAEFEVAKALALADPAVEDSLSDHGEDLVIDAHVVRSADPEDPIFGHRIVRLVFKTPLGYLSEPVVFVDLGEESVSLELAAGEK